MTDKCPDPRGDWDVFGLDVHLDRGLWSQAKSAQEAPYLSKIPSVGKAVCLRCPARGGRQDLTGIAAIEPRWRGILNDWRSEGRPNSRNRF